eukprot:m51a1_g13945 hypothetical protein (469) ;mRNA; f:897436-899361
MAETVRDCWEVVYEVPADITEDSFAFVMEKWRDFPENVWKGILKTQITPAPAPATTTEFALSAEMTEGTARPDLVDEVTITRVEAAHTCRTEFAPVFPEGVVPSRAYLPRFYPKVQKFAFTFEGTEEMNDGELVAKGTLRMLAVFLPGQDPDYKKKLGWATAPVVQRMIKWAKVGRTYKKQAHHDQLFAKEHYIPVYSQMKKKYREWLAKWEKTRTHTEQYVHEDIGIAAYFICLCEQERRELGITKEQQTFVDLGCGNGFLVYILSSEGYTGYGIDLFDRPVWNHYDRSKVILKAQQFDPSKGSFPGVRWVIGNHADELTPWVPVIAARSGPDTRYLNIACCFWNFWGKFQPNSDKMGKYMVYLKWLEGVGRTCGYEPEWDWMRIPSTKNICQVGRRRTPGKTAAEVEQAIVSLVGEHEFKVRGPDQHRPNCHKKPEGMGSKGSGETAQPVQDGDAPDDDDEEHAHQ